MLRAVLLLFGVALLLGGYNLLQFLWAHSQGVLGLIFWPSAMTLTVCGALICADLVWTEVMDRAARQ